MPSDHGNIIARAMIEVLHRGLTSEEVVGCEEIAINLYHKAVSRYIIKYSKSFTEKRSRQIKYSDIYAPIMNGIIVGALRPEFKKVRFKFNATNRRDIYSEMHYYLGDGFPFSQMRDILWLIDNASLSDVKDGINTARYRGVIHASYVKSIIIGNRRKASARLASTNEKYRHVSNEDVNKIKFIGAPNVRDIQERWIKRLKNADPDKLKALARGAQRKIQI